MQKELIISTTPQETKLAILEDDELVEFYIERHRSQGIVGNIYKGKVTKVLPGMQSAFVDIGLDRDAFLYVSDFFEDTEEYEKIVSTVEDEVAELQEGGRIKLAAASVSPAPPPVAVEATPEQAAATGIQPIPGEVFSEGERAEVAGPSVIVGTPGAGAHDDYDRRGGRGRRDRDRRGKKPKIPSFEVKSYESRHDDRTYASLEVLPGESLAKLSRRTEPEIQPETQDEDKNAALGAVAEEPPPVKEPKTDEPSATATPPDMETSRASDKPDSADAPRDEELDDS